MPETTAYRKWLASAETTAALIETIEVTHPAWGQVWWLANWDRDIDCTLSDLQTPVVQTFTAARFMLKMSSTGDSIGQGITCAITSLDGLLYDEFKSMTMADRQTPITLRTRYYLSNDLANVAVTPVPQWTVTNVTADFDVVLGTLEAPQLRTRRVGLYYVANELPIMRFLQ